MITKASVRDFRGIKALELQDLGRICLISGKNNVGKSSLLDAIFLFMDHTSNDSFAKVNAFRGSYSTGAVEAWEPFFRNMDADRTISISIGENDSIFSLEYEKDTTYLPVSDNTMPEDILAQFRTATRESYSLRFRFSGEGYQEQGHFFAAPNGVLRQMTTTLQGNEIRPMTPTRFLNASLSRSLEGVADGIGRLELSSRKQMVIEVLRRLDSSIEDIITISRQGVTQLHVRAHGKWIPIQFAGDGVLRLLQICLALLENNNGLVLIDEIEAGLHYSAYGPLWKAVEDLISLTGCQVIATTHSYEMISVTRDSIVDEGAFAYYRIGRTSSGEAAHRYSHAMLDSALDSEMEVR